MGQTKDLNNFSQQADRGDKVQEHRLNKINSVNRNYGQIPVRVQPRSLSVIVSEEKTQPTGITKNAQKGDSCKLLVGKQITQIL